MHVVEIDTVASSSRLAKRNIAKHIGEPKYPTLFVPAYKFARLQRRVHISVPSPFPEKSQSAFARSVFAFELNGALVYLVFLYVQIKKQKNGRDSLCCCSADVETATP